MNSENQEEELEVLKSIYEGDANFKEMNAKTFQYKYGTEGDPHSFVLEISWPESYPESLPIISLDAFYNKHMQPSVKENIIFKLLKEADANIGSAMTYTLIEWVKENLEELLVDQPLNLDTCTSHVANLEIDDKVEPSSKDNKDRRSGLTKAQKRRQWDRMDGKGEKIRGFDWVDVIKHLSQTGGAQAS
ncbi:RWD domain-containing protein 4-like [Daphnia carinata]|uniref:RWD domain-containing protein 4-like n=1 Tax=Daphnia carinata TaxID=120202 RepID=UPI00257C8891|nr:RWD domain-containing protein 4-like [Daphnia carinata]